MHELKPRIPSLEFRYGAAVGGERLFGVLRGLDINEAELQERNIQPITQARVESLAKRANLSDGVAVLTVKVMCKARRIELCGLMQFYHSDGDRTATLLEFADSGDDVVAHRHVGKVDLSARQRSPLVWRDRVKDRGCCRTQRSRALLARRHRRE